MLKMSWMWLAVVIAQSCKNLGAVHAKMEYYDLHIKFQLKGAKNKK